MHSCIYRRFRLLHGGLIVLLWASFLNPIYAQDHPSKGNYKFKTSGLAKINPLFYAFKLNSGIST